MKNTQDDFYPVALTIAGSDSGGGSGIQADLRTFNAAGVYGCSVITAVTAQNPRQITAVAAMEEALVKAQLESVFSAIKVKAVKTGMLANEKIVKTVAETLKKYKLPLIVDPVMFSNGKTALLDEAGNPTEKYFAAQKIIRKYAPDRPFGTPEKGRTLPACKLEISAMAELFENLDNVAEKVTDNSPLSFEELDQPFGYVLYRTKLPGNGRGCFELQDVRDRADLYLNGDQIYTYYRKNSEKRTNTYEFSAGATLDVLVENLGRINYGPLCGKDSKGVCGDIRFEWQALVGWEMWCLPSATPPATLNWKAYAPLLRATPAYYKVEFDVEDPADTYLKFPGIHGGAWINGHVLGRYWNIGPGSTLYIPGVWLKKGRNELVIFETEKLVKPYIQLLDHPELDKVIDG